ncbi:Cytochrome c oxidase-assembly factor cox23, mitochondrial [Penicillium brasilianum]|uniref:Cytochrome c oxidase-assembly factor cox23, mitochondrial n=1 Tax=Penicillium brasilianum TaxID=104259 RepID=A0A0F7TRM7_PENBI|nr:Cytochrome c oxidase-assembly factor cox23, mitochondrial [Penicillium brasilianum]CEJ59379.1 Putative Cytochrome c oxidase-assembly factor cox23, mitochondrial [Penicillium brasilianum]
MPVDTVQDEQHDKAWEKAERKFSHKTASEYYDPCQDFADRSLKCMKRNGFDREMCGDYFQAYRDCKKNWLNQKKAAPQSK